MCGHLYTHRHENEHATILDNCESGDLILTQWIASISKTKIKKHLRPQWL